MRRARRLVVGAAVLGLALTACSSSSSSSGSTSSTTGEPTRGPAAADAALDRAITALVKTPKGPPGIAVVVQRGAAAPAVHAAGTGTVGQELPITGTDHLRIASVAKAYSGATALALVRDGKLGVDDTVGRWLPAQPAAWHPVTVRQLLQHTSGVPDFSTTPAFIDALKASLTVPPPPEQLLTYVADRPLEFAPGTRYHYSNSDNVLVGLIVEAVTGGSYPDALASLVAAPLGLQQTTLPSGTEVPVPLAHGYDLGDATPEDVTSIIAAGWTWASGGVVSTPLDSNTFVRAYASGKLTNQLGRAAQRTVRPGSSEPPGPGENRAGMAIFRYDTRCGTVYGHTGNTPGYTHFIAASGDGTRSAVVAVNKQMTPKTDPRHFPALRHIFELAVCASTA